MDAQTLRAAMLNQISLARAQQEINAANEALRLADCTTVNRAAMFLAQLGHESLSLRYSTEIASGAAYNGRKDLGNVFPGDGPRYRGRSYIQVTGRHNYGLLSAWASSVGLVESPTYFVDNPERLADTRWAWVGPVWYWRVARPKLGAYSDALDIRAATKAINGGFNGLVDRTTRFDRCRAFGPAILPSGPAAATTAPAQPAPTPVRRPRGDDADMFIQTPEPAAGQQKWDWPTRRLSFAFDRGGGWGGQRLFKANWSGRGGWIHLARWWVRDPNWSANVPRHFPKDHPLGSSQGHAGNERFVGYGWETMPEAGADEIELVVSAPDGVHLQCLYER